MTILGKYYHDKALSYHISPSRNQKILSLLKGIKGNRILDVGCATGYLGKSLKEQINYVVGIDISPPAIKAAKKILDEAYICDIENDKLPDIAEKFDLIILAEVIEHLFDPKASLVKITEKYLKTDGEIIITTPNFLSAINRTKLLLGKFEYVKQGLLDESHIRFFTFSSLRNILSESGFQIIKEDNIFVTDKVKWLLRFFPGLFVYQFVVIVKKL